MELIDALSQISEIRGRLARSETFRGYRSATVAFTGLLAVGGAGIQALWLPQPEAQLAAWLGLWLGLAAISLVVTAGEIVWRCRQSRSPWTVRLARLAAEQFLPCVAAGGLLAAVLVRFAPEAVWLLPGLWAALFGLGVFASARLLPGPIAWVGVWYLVAGAGAIVWARGPEAFSPWAMAVPFGVGQLIIAAILYANLEQRRIAPEDSHE